MNSGQAMLCMGVGSESTELNYPWYMACLTLLVTI